MSTAIYEPGNPATYNPSTGGNLAGYNEGVASYTGNVQVYNPPSGGGLVYWSASFFSNDNGQLEFFFDDPVQIGFQYYPQFLTTPTLPDPVNVYANPAAGPHEAIGQNIYITYSVISNEPGTSGTATAEYNAGTLDGYIGNNATYNPVLSGGNPATYNEPTITGYNPLEFTPGNAFYVPGNIASYNPRNVATYNPTNISGYNPTSVAGYNPAAGGVTWNSTTNYSIVFAFDGSPIGSGTYYGSGSDPSCPTPTSFYGPPPGTPEIIEYTVTNYECTPSASPPANYNPGNVADYIGNIANYNPSTVGNYSGNNVNYNTGNAGNYTGNFSAGFAPGGNPATYNEGNPATYNPTFVGGFSGNVIGAYTGNNANYNAGSPATYNETFVGGFSGNTISGYTGNNANYNSGSPATYTGNTISGYNPAPPPSYNIGNPASYTSNFVSGYNSGNPATYTGNNIASYTGNFVATYNPGSASTYNFPIPGTPGEPGYAFGVYFPGGGVCAPGVYVNEQEISYYFENQEIDYRNHAIEVPSGGQIVVRIE
jgi:hypothetical protein